ncbi:glutamate synthase subunit beta [Staphylococcus aureus]|nr:glutamate synthase subunit beta [Staphylococcus aureus]
MLLSIGFVGTETTVPHAFDIQTECNKIVADNKDFRTNQPHIFAAGDA